MTDKSPEKLASFVKRALPHLETIFAVPVLHAHDRSVSNPVEWIKEKVATIAPEQMEESA